MKKKLLFAVVFILTSYGFSRLDDPLSSLIQFILAGAVPGTEISLGFFPSLALVIGVLVLIRKIYRTVQFDMLKHRSEQIKDEQIKKDFKIKNSGLAKSIRPTSVVIAPRIDIN